MTKGAFTLWLLWVTFCQLLRPWVSAPESAGCSSAVLTDGCLFLCCDTLQHEPCVRLVSRLWLNCKLLPLSHRREIYILLHRTPHLDSCLPLDNKFRTSPLFAPARPICLSLHWPRPPAVESGPQLQDVNLIWSTLKSNLGRASSWWIKTSLCNLEMKWRKDGIIAFSWLSCSQPLNLSAWNKTRL